MMEGTRLGPGLSTNLNNDNHNNLCLLSIYYVLDTMQHPWIPIIPIL